MILNHTLKIFLSCACLAVFGTYGMISRGAQAVRFNPTLTHVQPRPYSTIKNVGTVKRELLNNYNKKKTELNNQSLNTNIVTRCWRGLKLSWLDTVTEIKQDRLEEEIYKAYHNFGLAPYYGLQPIIYSENYLNMLLERKRSNDLFRNISEKDIKDYNIIKENQIAIEENWESFMKSLEAQKTEE